MTDSDEETVSFSEALGRFEDEIEIAARHLEVLRIVVQSGPAGIIDIADQVGAENHKIRHSLRVLEEENLILPSPEGASATDGVSTAIADANDRIEALQSRLESHRAYFGDGDTEGAAPTEAPAGADDGSTHVQADSETSPDGSTGSSDDESDRPSTSDRVDTGATATVDAETDSDDDGTQTTAAGASSNSVTEQNISAGIDSSQVPDVSAVPSPAGRSLEYDAIEVGEKLGHGGSATVHKAWFDDGGERVPIALKMPNFDHTVGPAVFEAFGREAENWSRISARDHVVGVVDSGTQPKPWIALEYMDGGTLADRVGELSIEQTVWTMERTTQAVRHDKTGFVHLDLKPENVLLRDTGPDTWDVPKVADWGLSRTLKEHQPTVDGLSPTYAAPEQFDAEAFGEPSSETDTYQLGVILYELLTGRPPFEGSDVAVMNSIVSDEPQPPSSVAEGVPAELSDITLKALAKEQDDRFSTVERLQSELQQFL
jgi:predicted transcriptional regulator